MANSRAEVLATGADLSECLGSYPTYSSPSTGLSVIIRVDSPVDVLLDSAGWSPNWGRSPDRTAGERFRRERL